jgi:RES domain-containing protein
MILYRLTREKYINDLSGAGAKAYGGRWNSIGMSMLYLTSSRSLAVLEVLVHLRPLFIPDDYYMITIEAPDDFEAINLKQLPPNWKDAPDEHNLKPLGDRFLSEKKHLLLQVPSSIVNEEFNYLANPLHEKASKLKVLKINPFSFDSRLLS